MKKNGVGIVGCLISFVALVVAFLSSQIARAIDPQVKKSFHQEVEKISRKMAGIIEFRADTMIPLPGTCQGGSIPRWSGNAQRV